MIRINDTIFFDEGVELNLQNQDFQDWFNVNIMPSITFADGKNGTVQTCSTFDEFGRPESWIFENITVKAVYWTIEERPELSQNTNYMYNYNFNKFEIYGAI